MPQRIFTERSPSAQEIQRGASVARMPSRGAVSSAKLSFGPKNTKNGAKAKEKNIAVSSAEPISEPASGACHQL
ncbi:hypothetical protein D9M72_581680 [compost metagenome]